MRDNMVLRGSAAIVAVAAVAAVSACGTGGSGAAGQTHGPDTTSAAPSSGADALTGKSGGSTAGTSGSSGTGAAENCQKVTVSIGEPLPSDKTQSRIALTMMNSGTTDCVLRGFPGVRLGGKDGLPWDLGRTDDAVVDVPLAPGTAATSYLTYLPTTDASGWEVASLLVTPPNTTDTQAFEWTLGKVVLQDGATHPGTYVGSAVSQGN
ncbi:DUF4232 domain-containing protein [Umezawaea sp. Da 62-37]|uniref:DUF4232 domain-containing protein n=1 Tax=Umezawaea sp. Da 62-37 TaxID=3075927 RepID=UPI0028F73960|nr:DUF4232 domain-containing protein [Umezawaea sp. Da 62-37]WNV91130.1 DUF4232 domain-containing protein [Umezawaea sp. Da 62-37]